MALIVENGTQPAGANSYISAADATTYITNYNPAGLDVWPSDQPSQEAALIQGCQALELLYGPQYESFRILGNQTLLWPRYTFYDKNVVLWTNNAIPPQLGQAQAELAVAILNGTDPFPSEIAQANIKEQWDRIGGNSGVESRIQFFGIHDYALFRKVDNILWPILKQKCSNRMSR